MKKNRDRIGLVAAILGAAATGANKTRIMYAANMSFKLLEKYLRIVLNLGFVQTDGSHYELTMQGREFLLLYRRFQNRHFQLQKVEGDLAQERELLERTCRHKIVDVAAAPP